MQFGVIGDVHGNFGALDRILARHPDIPFWLCVGDVANAAGDYPAPTSSVYWIKGNNESFDRIDAMQAGVESIPNLHYIPNGAGVRVGGMMVAGLGGTLAPTWYETPAAALPHPIKGTPRATALADKRRHFVRADVEACKALGAADVLLTHEAPAPFWVELPSSSSPSKRWRRDVGKAPVSEVADALRPRLHLFGHHHTYAAFTRAGVPTVSVDRVNRSYLLVDGTTFAVALHPTPGGPEPAAAGP